MAYRFYVTVTGTRQGLFSPESTDPAHPGTVTGTAFHYGIEIPRDPASGQATGRRRHHPVSFVKEWGAASPQFFTAITTNEVLESAFFEFVRPDESGQEHVFATVRLRNAHVSEIEQYVEGFDDGSVLPLPRPHERIALTFQIIELENLDGGTSAVDEHVRA